VINYLCCSYYNTCYCYTEWMRVSRISCHTQSLNETINRLNLINIFIYLPALHSHYLHLNELRIFSLI
jgi:hypothetical protein